MGITPSESVGLVLVVVFTVFVMMVEGSKEQEMEFKTQLNILNKPPIETFLSQWGDTYDCIDIYKQPALAHPLLRNHKIQMKPNRELKNDRTETVTFRSGVERCPEGSVPIRRTRKEDLIRARSLSSTLYASRPQYFAGTVYQNDGETFNGATANISVWQPSVTPDQFSAAEISLKSGWNDQSTRIHVGWMVNPMLYSDPSVRLFTYWTADNGRQTGCFNTLCPGFVQVHPQITPDVPIPFSIYQGTLNDIQFHIYLDLTDNKWWYVLRGDMVIGYWPAEIFPLFGNNGAERIYWGGHTRASARGDGLAPEMGSGHFPSEHGYGQRDAYFASMQYYNASGFLLDPNEKLMSKVLGCKRNYNIEYYGSYEEEQEGHSLQYGGPGGNC